MQKTTEKLEDNIKIYVNKPRYKSTGSLSKLTAFARLILWELK
jgi:hypothetical protein